MEETKKISSILAAFMLLGGMAAFPLVGCTPANNENVDDQEQVDDSEVDNEELTYNGNRAEMQAKREAKAREDSTYYLGHGASVSVNRMKDEDGNITERSLSFEKRPDENPKEIEIEFFRGEDPLKETEDTDAKKEGSDGEQTGNEV